MFEGALTIEKYGLTLPGFDKIHRYHDGKREIVAARILPGEYYVTKKEEIIVTTLGSCVSVAMRDPKAGIGGMNHFMLPQKVIERCSKQSEKQVLRTKYGNYAMDLLIEDIVRFGGDARHLEIKIFGGGNVLDAEGEVGENNIEYVREYLRKNNLYAVSECVGDVYPRKLIYYPMTGRAMVKKLLGFRKENVYNQEKEYMSHLEIDASRCITGN